MDESVKKCDVCGIEHPPDRMELTFKRPSIVAMMSSEERASRCSEGTDLCVVDNERFFVRGLLPLPIPDENRTYRIGLWAEVGEGDFSQIYDLWDDEQQSEEPPFAGTIANSVPLHKETLGLPIQVKLISPTARPEFFIQKTPHLLYQEQTAGISPHRAYEYSSLF